MVEKQKINTSMGLINRGDLSVIDKIEEYDNTRVNITEWYLQDCLVRRDVLVNVLSGISLTNEQGNI